MTGAVLDRPGTEQFELDGGLTLEECLNATIEAARAPGGAECPVCHARMRYTRAEELAAVAAAECSGCGSRVS